MKKTTVCCVASALAVSMVSSPLMNVMADTTSNPVQITQEQTPIEIKTPEEFLNTYLKVKVENSTKDATEDVYVLITEATKDNYEQLLNGNKVYETLSEELQSQIQKMYQDEYDKIVRIDSTQKQEEKKDAYSDLINKAQEVEKAVQEEQSKENDKKDSSVEIKKDSQTNTDEKSQKEDATISKEADLDQVDQSFGQPSQEETKQETSQQAETNLDATQNLLMPQAKPSQSENITTQEQNDQAMTVLPQIQIESNETKVEKDENIAVESTKENVEKQTTVSNEQALSSAATQFIQTYLTSSSGNIFVTANALNYQKIISATNAWVQLSKTDRDAVNAELKSKGGLSYQKLLQEAQKITFSTGKYVSVNTATHTNINTYAWLCMASLGLFTYVMKRLRKQD